MGFDFHSKILKNQKDLSIYIKRQAIMDHSTIGYLEELICRKIMRYHDLYHCLEVEKVYLVELNVDHLWVVSREKEEICKDIKRLREDLFSTLAGSTDHQFTHLMQILDIIPRNNRPRFEELFFTVNRLKCEIDAMRKENMIYINESLRFLDEMISVITDETQPKSLYTDKCRIKKSNHYLMLNKEV